MSARSPRPLGLTLIAGLLLAASGCRTAGLSDLTRNDPPLIKNNGGESTTELLAVHNRNAERIESLEASPSVTVTENGHRNGTQGRLAFERQKNFFLELRAATFEVAKIGSNDQEFWIWVRERNDPKIYFCNYDETGSSPLSTSFQPDWIMQAIGLRVIPEDEMKRMTSEKGLVPDTVVLTMTEKSPNGDTTVRETTVQESTGRILEHAIYTADHKTLLSSARAVGFQEFDSAPGTEPERVYLPKKVRIEWTQEKLVIDVDIRQAEINPKFDATRRAALFVEPKMRGVERQNLANAGMIGRPANATRETLPAPSSTKRPAVRLDDPQPLGDTGAIRTSNDAAAIAANNPPAYARGVEEVVGPPLASPTEPGPRYIKANSGWRNSLLPPDAN